MAAGRREGLNSSAHRTEGHVTYTYGLGLISRQDAQPTVSYQARSNGEPGPCVYSFSQVVGSSSAFQPPA